MIPEQLAMLQKMHGIFQVHEGLNDLEAFTRLIEWVAVQTSVQIGVTTEWMKESTHKELHKEFRPEILRDVIHDWFGELYHRLIGTPWSALDIVKTIADGDARVDWDPSVPSPPKAICFPHCGTGFDIIATFKTAGNSAIYYGLELDTLKYRVTLVNMALYGIPAHILCADYTVIDPFMGSDNWRFSNIWEPLPVEEFKLRPHVVI
ncbi:hypothetical protein D3C85_567410 [compost metagenome]